MKKELHLQGSADSLGRAKWMVPAMAAWLCACFSPNASADATADLFRRLDANGDGFLSGTEVKNYVVGGVLAGDQNGDKMLTLEEFEIAVDIVDFNALDKNQDGFLSGSEKTGLSGYDADENGRISQTAFLKRRLQLRGKLPVLKDALPGPFDISGRLQKVENGLAVAEADGSPSNLPKIEASEVAQSASLAIAPDASFHLVEMQESGGKRALGYKASPDAITWSKLEEIPVPGDQSLRRGDYQLVVDGAGTPVIFYSVDGPPLRRFSSAYHETSHTLYVRARKAGKWTDPVRLGEEGSVFGWTPLVDARGAVSVVWCEYFPVVREGSKDVLSNSSSSLVRWAGIADGAPTQALTLVNPNFRLTNSGWDVKTDAYERPRGYVARDGSLHLVLERVKSITDKEDDCGLVYLTANGAVRLLPFKTADHINARASFPPSLQQGPDGREYLITHSERPDKFAVLVHTLANGVITGDPARVFSPTNVKGAMVYGSTATFHGSAQGEILMGLPFGPSGTAYSDPVDCVLLRATAAGWSPPVDATNSALRIKLVQGSKLQGFTLPNPRVIHVSVAHAPKGEGCALVLYSADTWSTASDGTAQSTKGAKQFMILRWAN